MQYGLPKGVFDLLPCDPAPDGAWRSTDLWLHVEQIARTVAAAYGFREIRTPIFERTELFIRGVGESSDIVNKEMYTFLDKGERSMTLRPEGTASVMRAYVEKHLEQTGKCNKLYYLGPMFRYERPQAGRFRQHHQFGVESIGENSPEADVEVIDLLCTFYRKLGLSNLSVAINSVGDAESRAHFRSALSSYLEPFRNSLSPDSQIRLDKNPLRILDSKDPEDQKILSSAPSLEDSLSEEAKSHLREVMTHLKKLGIEAVKSPKLVRGLDYYSGTVFEVASGQLGAQNTIGAGGRYDGLLALLGGPDLPGVGFATGLERVIQTMIGQGVPLPSPQGPLLYCIPLGPEALDYGANLVYALRHLLIPAEIDRSGKKIASSLKTATTLCAQYVLVIGEEELKTKTVTLKQLDSRDELRISLDEVVPFLIKKHQGAH